MGRPKSLSVVCPRCKVNPKEDKRGGYCKECDLKEAQRYLIGNVG